MELTLDTNSLADYRTFLKIKQLPSWSIVGNRATFPDEYATHIGVESESVYHDEYESESFLFDYQRDIVDMAIRKKKYAIFADCGLGKTLMILSYAREVSERVSGKVLIVAPKLVVPQTVSEAIKFWGEYPIEIVKASGLAKWMESDGNSIGITNYEALKEDTPAGNLKCLILDESSVLKSHYGQWAGTCLRLGQQCEYKLALTGTPAPNDRIEYANHAVFLDRFPTVNSFLATYFINRGQTGERWEIKPHAIKPFYRALSDWCIFLSRPSVYGWKDHAEELPPIHTHIHHVELTKQQRDWLKKTHGTLVARKAGGITQRASFGQVAKGWYKGQTFATKKYEVIRDLVDSWRDEESTLVWCIYDHEQSKCHSHLGGDSMDGKTKDARRQEMIADFQGGRSRVLISKPRILGFGINLQQATRQVFSGLQDSYESYYQAVKRSNRIGSTKPLNVHIPLTEFEEPMIENVLRKADRVESDTIEQEELFKSQWMR